MFRLNAKASSTSVTNSPDPLKDPTAARNSPLRSQQTSRLPVPHSAKKSEKRAFSPPNLALAPPEAASPLTWRHFHDENACTDGNSSVCSASPLKMSRVDSVAEAMRARLSYGASPTKNNTSHFTGNPAPSASSPSARGSAPASPASRSLPNAYGINTAMLAQTGRRRSTLSAGTGDQQERIRVCVRKRPLSAAEQPQTDILEVEPRRSTVTVLEQRVRLDGINRYTERHEFCFDNVFGADVDNRTIYRVAVQDLVGTVVAGGKATCFAYGQTGSGKTHTMLSPSDGLYFLAATELLARVRQALPGVSVAVAFFEIYQNCLFDLLNDRRKVLPCEGSDGQVHIVGLTESPVASVHDLQAVMQEALVARSTGSTAANAASSRSHAILQFILKAADGRLHGKFSFIDLAGSERGSDRATVDRRTRLEGAEINKSLLALKECIRAIDLDSSHLPFRQSKLTLVLKDSFVGNAKTCMIATVSPTVACCEHSLNTLRYADRVKELKGSDVDAEFSPHPHLHPHTHPTHAIYAPKAAPEPVKGAADTRDKDDAPSASSAPPPLAKHPQRSPDPVESPANAMQANLHPPATPVRQTAAALDDSLMLYSDPDTDEGIAKRLDRCQQTLAVLYDRLSLCRDSDLLDIMQDELEGLLSALPPCK